MKFWTKFRSRLKPKRPFKLTPGGWVFILYTIGVGAGAINTGNNLLYLIFGLFLGFIIASGVLSDADLWRLDVAWHFPQAAQARQPCSIPLSITNRKSWLPSVSVTVHVEGALNGEAASPAVFVPSVLPHETIARDAIFIPARRGRFTLKHIQLTTKFPFGLLKKVWTPYSPPPTPSLKGRGNNDGPGFYVYPALVELTEADYAGFIAGNEEMASSERRGEGTTISGVREFAPEDSAKRIHWKSSAKHNTLLVRETDLDKKRDVEIYWPKGSPLPMEEEFVEFTASLIWGFNARGHGVRFLIENQTPVVEAMNYLSVVDVINPAGGDAAVFLGTGKRAAYADLADRINALGAYQQWKKRK